MATTTLERQRHIAHFIRSRDRVSVEEVCTAFSISPATARRDLDHLAEQGKIRRVHGGAIALPGEEDREVPMPRLARAASQAEEKARIGAAAAALIRDGETIFLGSGTTVLEVALRLRRRQRLNVITNSLLVLDALACLSEISVVSLGGVLNHTEMSFIGHITQQALSEVRADKVFLGIGAVDLHHGLTNPDLQETLTDRAILGIGREIILLADHTKCSRAAAAFVAPMSAVHTLITDRDTPAEFIAGVRRMNIEVIVV